MATKPPAGDPVQDAPQVEPAPHSAAGLPAVAHSLRMAQQQMGVRRTARTLLKVNQKDGFDCPGCACEAYVKSSQICDEAGNCGPPLSGSGCVGGGYYAGPPMRCAGGGTLADEGGCILRYLVSAGNCD